MIVKLISTEILSRSVFDKENGKPLPVYIFKLGWWLLIKWFPRIVSLKFAHDEA